MFASNFKLTENFVLAVVEAGLTHLNCSKSRFLVFETYKTVALADPILDVYNRVNELYRPEGHE